MQDTFSLNDDNPTFQRFLINCQRTRRFDNSPLSEGPELLSSSRRIIQYLGKGIQIFPHLTYLAVSDESMVPLFMSSTVTELVWVFNHPPGRSVVSAIQDVDQVIQHMPHISTLSLLGDCLALNFNTEVIDLCTKLTYLHTVILSRHTLSPLLLQTLMRKPTMSSIEIDTASINFQHQYPTSARSASCRWLDPAARFPMECMTKLLAFGITLPDIHLCHSFFASGPVPTIRLQRIQLFLSYPQLSLEPQLRNFLHDLCDWSPNLSSLELTMVVDAHFPSELAQIDHLSFHTIEPLLQLSQLQTLIFVHSYPIQITDSEAGVLARGWPEIRRLELNPNPVVLDSTSTTLRAITAFARWCPRITHLSLYLDGTVPVTGDSAYSFGLTFRVLNLGASSCPTNTGSDSLWHIAEFLSQTLPSETYIRTGLFDAPDNVQQFIPDANGNLIIMPPLHLLQFDQCWDNIASMRKCFREWVRIGGLDTWASLTDLDEYDTEDSD